jgi:6-pyruvoyl-tetrahydropterin synthase
LITHQEIYFARPSSFNDPFDGNIPVRWDLLTYEECLQKNLELTQIFHKDKTLEIQKQIAKQITDSKKLWHPDNIKKESQEDIDKWDKLIGLLSLSEKRDDILMWSHYADFCRGFVVGLRVNSLIEDYDFDYLNRVEYQEKYPLITGHHEITERFKTKFFTKSSAWEYEKEWRISKNHIENRVVKIKMETFSEIILGCQMTEKIKEEINEIIKKTFGATVTVYQAIKADENFGLEMKPV